MSRRIYLDHNATTPVDERVLEAMRRFWRDDFGNAASRHHVFGWEAQAAVEEARETCAECLGCEPNEIIFTSGATESINFFLKGIFAGGRMGGRLITSAVEHRAVLDTARYLARWNPEIHLEILPVDSTGRVEMEALRERLHAATEAPDGEKVISLIHGNNEVGTLNPVREIASLCREGGWLFHSDTTQTIGKIPFDFAKMALDCCCASAHKFHGPKGVGLTVLRENLFGRIEPLLHGGGHERGNRSGTLNVAGIVGLAAALKIACEGREAEGRRLFSLTERLWERIRERIPEVERNGDPEERLPGTLNVSFRCVDAEALLVNMSEIALSSGSACSSAHLEPSYVLRAMGKDEESLHGSVRFSLGRATTEEEVDYVVERLAAEVERLRRVSPRWNATRKTQTASWGNSPKH
ncbi:MAG: cysteine desulfurase [Candidatus Hydrogenedentota bacterium]|nr:MAG: cysteine desulfurase [Candidatus Hydrogenedentota bacterium]